MSMSPGVTIAPLAGIRVAPERFRDPLGPNETINPLSSKMSQPEQIEF